MARRRRDYYVILGVERGASDVEIKRAFRELARKHHPDVKPADGGELFREINEAYAVLGDPEARARYDRWGHQDDAGGLSSMVDAAQDIINDVFRRRRTKHKGKDLRYTLEVTFEEAAFGVTKTINLPDLAGTPPGKSRELTVVIPPGMNDGMIKTVKGEGEPGRNGAAAGDLFVQVRVAAHPAFRRDGLDVRSEHVISFSQAALGAVLEVKTLDGDVKIRIPEGTQPGQVLRIRGRGIPHAAGKAAPRGDHLIEVQVTVPTTLSPRQRELIEELARTAGDELHPVVSKKGLLDRVVRSLLDE
ncbi:MAG: DnaJ C-terminal domain-containing protein [Kofleriaceae bacterium]